MELKKLVAITAAMLMLFSCSNDELGDLAGGRVPQGEVTIKAHMPSTADDSRASATLQDDKFVFAWQEGDAISLFNKKTSSSFNNNRFNLTAGSEGPMGEFTGSLASEGDIDCAIYPYNENHNFYKSGNTPTRIIYLPGEYGSYEEDYNGNTNAPMYAEPVLNDDGSYDMSFKHLGAVIRLELKSVPAEAACVRLNTGHEVGISGYFYVEYDNISENQCINVNRCYQKKGTSSIKFRPAIDIPEYEGKTGSEAARDMTFFFPVPTGEYKSLSFTLMDKNGQGICHPYVGGEDGRPFTLSRADVAMYPTVTLVYTPEGLIAMDDKTMEFNELINQNDSIKLDKDIEIGAIAISKNFTIDCNGHKLTTSGIYVESGTLTIKDSDRTAPYAKKSILPNGCVDILITVGPNGNLKLKNLNIDGHLHDTNILVYNSGGKLDMNYCLLEGYGYMLVTEEGSSSILTNCTLDLYSDKYSEVDCSGYIEFRASGLDPYNSPLAYIDNYNIGDVWVGINSTVVIDSEGVNRRYGNIMCKSLGINDHKPETIDVKIYGGIFFDPNILKYVEKRDDGSWGNVSMRLREDLTITEPIRVEKGNVMLDLWGYNITNTTDSNVNPATGEEDGNKYTCGLFVTGPETTFTLSNGSDWRGGISVNSISGTDGIRRAIWVNDGANLNIYNSKYFSFFSSQTNKNSQCEVAYTDGSGKISIEGGMFETDCFTGSDGSNEDNLYWVLNSSQKQTKSIELGGGEYVNFNPLHPGIAETGANSFIQLKDNYDVKVYDEDGNDITAEYKDKTYHEANLALKKGDENARITYKVVH
ncbi:MAG: fimbrillin family protein [Bacteroides sp.]|nr:fimbrillin family protein [Bacteroides sp.]